jgi:coenzyme F420-reducing hydrogenase delta subunit
MSVYTDNSYKDRDDYLAALADEYGLEIEKVRVLAEMLGEDEDFDGLVSELDDLCDEMEY